MSSEIYIVATISSSSIEIPPLPSRSRIPARMGIGLVAIYERYRIYYTQALKFSKQVRPPGDSLTNQYNNNNDNSSSPERAPRPA